MKPELTNGTDIEIELPESTRLCYCENKLVVLSDKYHWCNWCGLLMRFSYEAVEVFFPENYRGAKNDNIKK